jgi:outer membrane lipoprotein LolB
LRLRIILLLAASLLTACASTPPTRLLGRDKLRDFALEGRFALRIALPGQAVQNSGGRLSWTHQNRSDRVLLSSPLGYGLAEIEMTPEISRLRTAEGKTSETSDPETLIEEVTGQRLPISRLPAWLIGRSGGRALIEPDALGRPARLTEDGWQVDYTFETDSPSALPSRVTLSRQGEIELRLRIEEWKEAP